MSEEFVVRALLGEEIDPGRANFLSARDKILINQNANLRLLQQLPNENFPTRFLVEGDEVHINELLDEFKAGIVIEPNKKVSIL
ncbi:hypothetical protein [Nitrosomonas sp.]|uniref:hypothetical protein n=1 Tax=Nitrosomonas sp. TaxID=42353 RepID=UPI0025ED47AB|nr:hypothetical protein [Nitrosomonas sp.]MBY0484351.1 hypothetical protein [Nitrosomonas sp.]